MYGRILVPTDGSDHALAAAAHAGVLARAFDADVDVLHVVDLAQRGSAFDAGGATGEFVERLESEGEAAVEETAAAVPASHRGGTETVSGAVPATIHEYVADNAVGLIVMGTHGRTGLRRYVTGSVTEAVVREASVPVLTVQADTEAPEGGYGDVLVPTDGSDHALAAADRATEVAAAFDARIHVLSVVDLGSLAPGVDEDALDRIANPQVSGETLDVKARAIAGRQVEGSFAVSDVGTLSNADAIPQAADELITLEGITAVVVVGERDGTVHLSGRSRDDRVHMGFFKQKAAYEIAW